MKQEPKQVNLAIHQELYRVLEKMAIYEEQGHLFNPDVIYSISIAMELLSGQKGITQEAIESMNQIKKEEMN